MWFGALTLKDTPVESKPQPIAPEAIKRLDMLFHLIAIAVNSRKKRTYKTSDKNVAYRGTEKDTGSAWKWC